MEVFSLLAPPWRFQKHMFLSLIYREHVESLGATVFDSILWRPLVVRSNVSKRVLIMKLQKLNES
jgi:hypothetical protein